MEDNNNNSEVDVLNEEIRKMNDEVMSAEEKVRQFHKYAKIMSDLQQDIKKTSLKLSDSLKKWKKSPALKKHKEMKKQQFSLPAAAVPPPPTQRKSSEEVVMSNEPTPAISSMDMIQLDLDRLDSSSETLRSVLPETRSLFSRLLLGRVNLKLWSSLEKDRLRDEYHKFRRRTNYLFVLFPLVVLFSHHYLRQQWKDTHWLNIFHELWLLYYYLTMALRENILAVNGSNIHKWWIFHHYIAAFGTIILITWPPTETYFRFLPLFTWYLVFQGVVQMLQLIYQMRRDYANRALGNLQRMDVSISETMTEFPKELLVLVPCIFSAHFLQLFIGFKIYHALFYEIFDPNIHWTNYTEEVQMFITATVCFCLGIGNIYTTVLTFWKKAKKSNIGSRKPSKSGGSLSTLGGSASPNNSELYLNRVSPVPRKED